MGSFDKVWSKLDKNCEFFIISTFWGQSGSLCISLYESTLQIESVAIHKIASTYILSNEKKSLNFNAVFGTFDLNPVVHACASKKVFPFFANFAAITFLHSRPCITYKILVAGHLLSVALKSTHDCYETTLPFVRPSSESGSRNGARQCISSRTGNTFLSLTTYKEESNVKERLRVREKGSYRKGRRLMGEQEGEEHLGGSKEILRKPLDGGHRIRCLLKSSSAYNW